MSNETPFNDYLEMFDFTPGYFVVCVLDVLGQSSALEQWPIDPAELTAHCRTAHETVNRVRAFEFGFRSFCESATYSDPGIAERLSDAQLQRHHRVWSAKLKVQQFSDTFVFYASIQNEEGDLNTLPILQLVQASASIILMGLSWGMPSRGGIAIDRAAELPGDRLYGPALHSAYLLEQHKAEFPRLAVSENLLSLLEGQLTFSEDSEVNWIMSAFAADCRKWLDHDLDGQLIVDYLGDAYHATFGHAENPADMEDSTLKAYRYVCQSFEEFKKQGNVKLTGRYALLKDYFERKGFP